MLRPAAGLLVLLACRAADGPAPPAREDLDQLLAAAGVVPVVPPPAASPARVDLGRLLFFDKVLSGNQDIACSTCHHFSYQSTDKLSLGIGTGGVRAGPSRKLAAGRLLFRNTADLYNRGVPGVRALFHDGRIESWNGTLRGPAGFVIPPGVSSVLAAQVLVPLLGRDEMRGHPGDTTRLGQVNELALIPDVDQPSIHAALVARVMAYPEYVAHFAAAFPGVDSATVTIAHVAEAIAEFERHAFTHLDSPFDRYLAGDAEALGDSARQGAILFYGRLRCATCHSGALQADQDFHNIGIPLLGNGPDGGGSPDIGRTAVTGLAGDRFRFRTPSLRNVTLTGPWMHNGVYVRLDDAIRHYRDPNAAWDRLDPGGLDPRVAGTVRLDPATRTLVMETIDPLVAAPLEISERDVALVIAFLRALADPRVFRQLSEIPDSVPSGLPVRD